MKLSRDSAQKIHFFLDQIIPPIIRDSRWFTLIFFRIIFKDKARIFEEFKEQAMKMDESEFSSQYREVEPVLIQRETDLNQRCIEAILQNIIGKKVLEVGCGRGYLAKRLSENYAVTATDIIINPKLIRENPNICFKEANMEKLPFENNEFDTVISTHTLEHVQNIFQSINELRRVTKNRLIIIVPKQRPYKYTFDLHLHFFPYKHSLLSIMGTVNNKNHHCEEYGGDLFYYEDKRYS